MDYSRYAASIQAAKARGVVRPWGVTLVAFFQALKAGVLLATGLLLYFSPETVLGSRSVFYPILYIAMRGRTSLVKSALSGGSALSGVILLLGMYLVYIASGLSQMKPSARKAVMLTSGMTLVLYVKSTLLSTVHDSSLSDISFFAPNLHNVHLVLFIDTAIFAYLMRGSTANQFMAGKSGYLPV